MNACSTAAAGIFLALACANIAAADRQDRNAQPLPPVEVRALRDPVEKSYRRIVRGMDVFQQQRTLAPDAALRFKLLPRTRETSMEGIQLSIVGERVDVPVSVARDHTFALPRSPEALADDAVVTPNRQARTMTWRADIRTPGLPANTRRLGDLRLECQVGMEAGLVSGSRSIVQDMVRAVTDVGYCDQPVPEYFFFADRPLWSVTLVHGNRRETLSIDYMYAGISREAMTAGDLEYCDCAVLIDRAYYAPLGDRSWPDETRVVLEYMADDLGASGR